MYKILIVDDDRDMLIITKAILEINNILVSTISTFEQIDSSIAAFNPDLILLDTYFGTADGRDICRKLKKEIKTKDISILLYSAASVNELSLDACADGFIQKPFTIKNLVSKINSILSVNTISSY